MKNRKISFEYPNKSLLNQATQKESQNQKFQTQKNPSIIPVTWNPEYPLAPQGPMNPFCIPSIDKYYPFHIPSLEHCISFNCCKYTGLNFNINMK